MSQNPDTTAQFTTPVEIDTEIARLLPLRYRFQAQADYNNRRLNETWTKIARDPSQEGNFDYTLSSLQAALEEALGKLVEVDAQIYPLEAKYTGWNRYSIVTNTNGHVHRSQHCTTCYPTTQYGWIPSLSDCVEADLVAEYGELACTVCFPEAPTYKGFGDGTSAIARYTAAEKAERAAIKAEKAAAKAAKTLNATVRVNRHGENGFGDRIETVAAAKKWIKDTIDDAIIYGYNLDARSVAEGVFSLTGALAEKGVDVVPLIEKWTKAAQKKAR